MDSIEYTQAEFFRECTSREGPRARTLQRVADFFEISLDDLIDDRIDNDWVRAPSLNATFQAKDGSKFRTSMPIIQWIEKNYGNHAKTSIMRALKIPSGFLDRPEQSVKLRLLRDLISASKERGISNDEIFEIGLSAVNIPENDVIRKILSSYRSPKDAYEFFFCANGLVEHFEKNYRYRIEKMSSHSIVLSATPFEHRMVENGSATMHDPALSVYRWGVAAGVLELCSGKLQSVTPVKVPDHHGGAEHFEISWASPRTQAARESGARPRLILL